MTALGPPMENFVTFFTKSVKKKPRQQQSRGLLRQGFNPQPAHRSAAGAVIALLFYRRGGPGGQGKKSLRRGEKSRQEPECTILTAARVNSLRAVAYSEPNTLSRESEPMMSTVVNKGPSTSEVLIAQLSQRQLIDSARLQ